MARRVAIDDDAQRLVPPRAWRGFAVLGAVLAVAYAIGGPLVQTVAYGVAGTGAVGAILVAALVGRPAARAGWLLLAASQAAFVVGDGIFALEAAVLADPGVPGVADAAYLAGYPLLLAAMLRIQGLQLPSRRGAVVESGILGLGLALLGWTWLIGPTWASTELPLLGRLVATAYPAMDVLLLGVVLRTLLPLRGRSMALRLVLVAVVLATAANVGYLVAVSRGGYEVGGLCNVAWLASYVVLGTAALHPSASAPAWTPRRQAPPPLARAVLLPSSLLAAPVLLVWQEQRGLDHTGLALVWVVLIALVSVRTGQLVADLSRAVRYDRLTGCLTRAALLVELEDALDRLERGREVGVAVTFFGMEDFKLVNDGLGHDVGDALLQHVARRLERSIGPNERLGRLGGDEFVVLTCGAGSEATLAEVEARLRAALDEPFVVGGTESFYLRARVGGCRVGPGRHDVSELLRAADVAMERGKRGTRSSARAAEGERDNEALEDLRIRSALREAVTRDQLRLHYQPEVRVDTGELDGFEALLRWEHPERGLLAPGPFIGAAEETGEICAMGEWALVEACRQLRAWRGLVAGASPTVAVNVSVRQLADGSLPRAVDRALATSGLPASALTVEITESALMADVVAGASTMRVLKAMGVAIAIDDFGTGYSSLSQLRRFPIDLLKIDRSFVQGLVDSAEDRAVVAAVVTLAHALGVRAIAEGVERPEQLRILRELGCELAQGFLLARPLAPGNLEGSLPRLQERWAGMVATGRSPLRLTGGARVGGPRRRG